jgi:hypothetical protein
MIAPAKRPADNCQEANMTPEDFENFDLEAYYAAKKLRKVRPWVCDIIRVLWDSRSSISMQNAIRLGCPCRWSSRQPYRASALNGGDPILGKSTLTPIPKRSLPR